MQKASKPEGRERQRRRGLQRVCAITCLSGPDANLVAADSKKKKKKG
jgi:hypothetical protein